MEELPQVNAVDAAVGKLAARLTRVEPCAVSIDKAAGRVAAHALLADRDSPALDVSAMDGYAIRLADCEQRPLPVSAIASAGSAPIRLAPGTAVRIFTGAAVPHGAECIVRREDTTENAESVTINVSSNEVHLGLNIRRRGENISQSDEVLASGTLIGPAAMAAIASFAPSKLQVSQRVRITVLNTGDELARPGEPVEHWQIRDSNGPVLDAWLEQLPWVELVARQQVADHLADVKQALTAALPHSDAVILTGGVSMGDTDYVAAAIEQIGGEIAFHRLPIRPGKPVLGAFRQGKLILGLPGNPVSVAVTARVIGLPLLRKLAGIQPNHACNPRVGLANPDENRLDLTWYRLVEVDQRGQVQLAQTRGSGDLVSLARSYGFVEIPAGQTGAGPWKLYSWNN